MLNNSGWGIAGGGGVNKAADEVDACLDGTG